MTLNTDGDLSLPWVYEIVFVTFKENVTFTYKIDFEEAMDTGVTEEGISKEITWSEIQIPYAFKTCLFQFYFENIRF